MSAPVAIDSREGASIMRVDSTSTTGTEPISTLPTPTSHRVARNSALHFLSVGLSAATAIFLVPITVRALGAARFGLLALAWAVAEGAGMFDLGLARTTVRFVADSLARKGDRLREIIFGSVLSQSAFGIVAGGILYLAAPLLVGRVFNIPASSSSEALSMFHALAFHIPVLLAAAALRAALEGAQRFDVSSAIRIPGSLASVAVPAIAASAGASLATIIWILLGVRLVLVAVSAFAVGRILIPGRWALPASLRTIREMFAYSGWVAVSAALGPALGSFERFLTGSVVGIAGLGYYTGAAEAATRLLLIPATAFAALLPALAHTDVTGGRPRALAVTRAARRQLAALILPVCLALLVFAPMILDRWLGKSFGDLAGTALRILSIGVFLGGLAHLPLALLYGAGRPDLPAKIHIGEVIAYLPLAYLLVRTWGISGAGLAWSVRSGADLLLYEWVSYRALGSAPSDPLESRRLRHLALAGAVLALTLFTARWMSAFSPVAAIAAVILGCTAYAFLAWLGVLSSEERRAWLGMLPARLSSA
jgi:O-antigen/teichoic acid export membrane protein